MNVLHFTGKYSKLNGWDYLSMSDVFDPLLYPLCYRFFFLKNTTNENEKKYYNISYSMSNALSLYPINTDLTFAVLPPVLM